MSKVHMSNVQIANRKLLGNWADEPCWYASIQDAGRTQVVLGPFRTEAACREWAYRDAADGGTVMHSRLVEIAQRIDPKSWFYAWGMVKLQNGYSTGVLNKYIRTDGLWTGEAFEVVPAAAEVRA